MEWLSQNWFWVVVFVAFFAMHLFGHGGGCGGGHERRPPSGKEEKEVPPPSGHRH